MKEENCSIGISIETKNQLTLIRNLSGLKSINEVVKLLLKESKNEKFNNV